MKHNTQHDVKRFYDEQGWHSDDEGVTLDTKLWDIEKRSLEAYNRRSDARVQSLLAKQGRFFLDAGSGPARCEDYLSSYNFPERYCVDFSETALELARHRDRNHCKYVTASLTKLPFPNEFLDATVSLHVIYHIPQHEQEKAVRDPRHQDGQTHPYCLPKPLGAVRPVAALLPCITGKQNPRGRGSVLLHPSFTSVAAILEQL